MYLNGEGIQVMHMPRRHTDGDTVVFFRRGDVIATGDLIDTTRFPVIDVARGGSVQGEIDALNRLMDMSIHNLPLQWTEDRTLLVPGHGHVYDKLDLLEYRDAVTVVRDRVQQLIDQGQTLDQVKAANPTLGYRSQYGAESGPWTTDMFVEVIYRELSAKKSGAQAMNSRVALTLVLLALSGALHAQRGNPQPAPSARVASPIDLAGTWVSIVTQDWRWRMVPPPKGDYRGIPMTPEALQGRPPPGTRRKTKRPANSAVPTAPRR